MDIEIRKYLSDIEVAISSIDIHLQHKRDFNLYQSNITIKRAVEREIEIIGEATNRILKLMPNINISFAKAIVDMRNRVIHGYDSVDDFLVWKIVVKDIPVLKEEGRLLVSKNE